MEGTIDIQSRLGEGTKVTIALPVQTITEEEAEKLLGTASVDNEEEMLEGHILLAEDNEINTEIAMRIFEDMGVSVDHAGNGEEAVTMFNNKPKGTYTAVFMDLQMPVMDGYHAAAEIRKTDTDVPIIAMTADAYMEAMNKAKEAGMNDFVTKPLVSGELHRILKEILRKGEADET